MKWLLSVLGVWGIGDSLWLATHPRQWATFWRRWIGEIARRPPLALTLALVDLALSAGLLWWALGHTREGKVEERVGLGRI